MQAKMGKASWVTIFKHPNQIFNIGTDLARLDVAPVNLCEVDTIMLRPDTHRALDETPAKWSYGCVLHACFELLCRSSDLDHVRPLFPLVLHITQDYGLRFMLRTINCYGEIPIEMITKKKKGRSNASYILYRMCMSDSRMYIATIRSTWDTIRMNMFQLAHARSFHMCLLDVECTKSPMATDKHVAIEHRYGTLYQECRPKCPGSDA